MVYGGKSGVGVTAASEHNAPDRERAETYLRLQAEAELRRALAMPEYKPPPDPMPTRIARMFVQSRRMRRRRAILDRVTRRQTASQQAGSRSGRTDQSRTRAITSLPAIRTVTDSLTRARRVAAPPAAALLRAVTRTRYQLSGGARSVTWPVRRQLRRRIHRHRRYQAPAADACLTRLETLAEALGAAGAITTETGEGVVESLRAALAARSRIEPDAMLSYHMFAGRPRRRRVPSPAAPAGPPRAVPVGISASGIIGGAGVRFYLGVLVVGQHSVTLTARTRFPAELEERDHHQINPVYEALSETSAVDDRGSTYQAHFSGGGGSGEWDGQFHLMPAPQPGVRWLDVMLPGAPGGPGRAGRPATASADHD